jgi:hypothetical protein
LKINQSINKYLTPDPLVTGPYPLPRTAHERRDRATAGRASLPPNVKPTLPLCARRSYLTPFFLTRRIGPPSTPSLLRHKAATGALLCSLLRAAFSFRSSTPTPSSFPDNVVCPTLSLFLAGISPKHHGRVDLLSELCPRCDSSSIDRLPPLPPRAAGHAEAHRRLPPPSSTMECRHAEPLSPPHHHRAVRIAPPPHRAAR